MQSGNWGYSGKSNQIKQGVSYEYLVVVYRLLRRGGHIGVYQADQSVSKRGAVHPGEIFGANGAGLAIGLADLSVVSESGHAREGGGCADAGSDH